MGLNFQKKMATQAGPVKWHIAGGRLKAVDRTNLALFITH
jgi:hypothetical protein